MTVPPDVGAARQLTADVAALLPHAPAFRQLDPEVQHRLARDLGIVQQALAPVPYGTAMADPRLLRGRPGTPPPPDPAAGGIGGNGAEGPKAPPATAEIGARAGALLDEIDFASFVAGLVHSTFDAVLDATIRQLEAFADLVSSVAKTVDQFTSENVTPNQARDWLVEHYPADLVLALPESREGAPQVRVRQSDDFGPPASPAWLADFDLAGTELTDEIAEQTLVPLVRTRIGESRLQLLATMVLLGMNRIGVTNGRISARLAFRAQARDKTSVDFAISQDPGGGTWGSRGATTYESHRTLVSTVGVNAQSEAALQADLYGSVELNFVSETLPLERFADLLQQSLLQRNARWAPPTTAAAPAAPVAAVAPPALVPAPAPAPAVPVVPVVTTP